MTEPTSVPDPKLDFGFGETAIRENLCTFEQVKECLEVQNHQRAGGKQVQRLGEILVQKGYLSKEQVQRIIQTQQAPTSSRIRIPGYELLSKLGAGGMGVVFKARQVSMDRIVAIKVLSPKYSRDQQFIQRFIREARSVAKLNHENVISGIDVGEVGNLHYFVMEYVDGQTVSNLLKKEKVISEHRCLEIANGVLKALDHASQNGFVHRDIKPENIMIASDGKVKLCDLGLAKDLGGDASLTVDGTVLGTPNYVSPEQARGEQDLDIRSDIYSLAASLYHMATGTPVFSGPTLTAVMAKHVTDLPESPRKRNPALSEGFSRMVLRCLAKRPKERYQAPLDMAADVEKLLRGESLGEVPVVKRSTIRRPVDSTRLARPSSVSAVPGTPKKSQAVLLAVVGGVTVMALVLTFAIFSKGSSATHSSASSQKTALEKEHEERLKTYEDMRKAGRSMTQIYDILCENIERFRDTGYQTAWEEEQRKFATETNQMIARHYWDEIQRKAEGEFKAKRYSAALQELGRLPEEVRYFHKDPLRSEMTVPTDAERRRAQFERQVKEEMTGSSAKDEDEIGALISAGRFDEAYQKTDTIAADVRPEMASKVDDLRGRIFESEIERMFVKAKIWQEYRQADRRMHRLSDRYPRSKAIHNIFSKEHPVVEGHIRRTLAEALNVAEVAFRNRFHEVFLEELQRRNCGAARKLVGTFCFDSVHAELEPLLTQGVKDTSFLQKVVDYLQSSIPARKVLSVLEDALRETHSSGKSSTATSLYRDLWTLALLEDLVDQAEAGLPTAVAKRLVDIEGLPAGQTVTKVRPLREPGKPFRIQIETSSGSYTISLPEAEVVNLATYASTDSKSSLFHLQAALYHYTGGKAALAKSEFKKVTNIEHVAWFKDILEKLADVPDLLEGQESSPKGWARLFKGVLTARSETRFQAEYDFAQKDQVDDFMGGATATWLPDKAMRVSAEPKREMWYWKGMLSGDVVIEMRVKALSDGNLGFILCGQGMNQGYVCQIDFGAPMGRGPRFDGILKLPVEPRRSPQSIKEREIARAPKDIHLERGSTYTIKLVREGKKISFFLGGALQMEGEDAEYTTGHFGIWLFNSSMVLQNLRITGELDQKWLREQLKQVKDGK